MCQLCHAERKRQAGPIFVCQLLWLWGFCWHGILPRWAVSFDCPTSLNLVLSCLGQPSLWQLSWDPPSLHVLIGLQQYYPPRTAGWSRRSGDTSNQLCDNRGHRVWGVLESCAWSGTLSCAHAGKMWIVWADKKLGVKGLKNRIY